MKKYFTIFLSVIGLLDLSSAEVIAGSWATCSYNGNIYVTIPNAGNAPSEGNTFITSTSTSTNLQNFFIYNNQFTANYQNSAYLSLPIAVSLGGTGSTTASGALATLAGGNAINVANGVIVSDGSAHVASTNLNIGTSSLTLVAHDSSGDIEDAPWADYSGSSTIVGWSAIVGLGTASYIRTKKVGKTVFVQFDIVGTRCPWKCSNSL